MKRFQNNLFIQLARGNPGDLDAVQAEIRELFQYKMKVGLAFLCDGTHFSSWVLLSLAGQSPILSAFRRNAQESRPEQHEDQTQRETKMKKIYA